MTILLNLIDLFEDKVSKLRAFRSGERANIELGNFKDGFSKSVKLVCGGFTILKYGIAAPESALQSLKAELATRADIVGVRLDKDGLTIEVEPVDEGTVTPLALPPIGLDFGTPVPTIVIPPVVNTVESEPIYQPIEPPSIGLPPDIEDSQLDADPVIPEGPIEELPVAAFGLFNTTTISDGLTTIGTTGVDTESTYGSVVDKGLSKGVLTKKGAYIFYGDVNIGNGRAKAIETLTNNPEFFGQLNGQLI